MNISVEVLNTLILGKFDSFYYWRNLAVRIFASLWITYNKDKLREDLCWKGLIDDFQDGVIIVNKDKEISYKNKPVDVLFGLNNRIDK